jgi:flavin-dependent dehydrogenase
MHCHQICIIGAGPAGSAIALKLKQLGYDVLLIGQDEFSRNYKVESLTPGVFTLLDTIGVKMDSFAAQIIRPEQVFQKWGDKTVHPDNLSALLVDRGKFDKHIFLAASNLGIKVLQPAKVVFLQEVDRNWEIRLIYKGKHEKIKAEFLVDASGRKSVLKGTKKRAAAHTLAICGSWKNTGLPKSSMMLESAVDHWLWGGTLPTEIFNATVFLDPDIDFVGGGNVLMDYYTSALEKAKLFNFCRRGEPVGKISTFDVTPYYYEKPAGHNFIKVGEANFGLDPLSSQGIQSAILNAIQGAIVVNTILSDRGNSMDALEFYKQRQQEIFVNHLEMVSKSYQEARHWKDHLFWKKRTRIDPAPIGGWERKASLQVQSEMVQFSDQSRIAPTTCILNDQVIRRMGLLHPGLKRPIVFWDNREIDSILDNIKGIYSTSDLIGKWSEKISETSSLKLFDRLREAKVIISAN